MHSTDVVNLGQLIKQQRVMVPLTLQELAIASAVSSSHLGRIERGERFPSAQILRKIAKPLGFEENELFTLAGYLSPQAGVSDKKVSYRGTASLDPWVARTLTQEPLEVQRAAVSILAVLKTLARSLAQEENRP
jgi:transcriptional regulator with XRE-family HTH domain